MISFILNPSCWQCYKYDDNMASLCCICHELSFLLSFHLFITQVEAAKSGMTSSLLVRHPESKDLYVNFDPQILTLIRETECMARLGLDIPTVAKGLRAKQSHFKENYNALNVSDHLSPHYKATLGSECMHA